MKKHSRTRKSIYILCTGGTISMQRNIDGYALAPGHLTQSMAKIPELQNPDMPLYTIHEYDNPIDSANMTPQHWLEIGEHILANHESYDGFVILHGTDTMAYTASVLSFMLENLRKPIILTGSQLPLFETRNDARENLINAILICSRYPIPEVCVYFNNKLFRGNRTKKMDANSFTAFASPNFPALGTVGTDILIRQSLIRETSTQGLQLQAIGTTVIGTLRLFPGLSLALLQHLLQPPLQALVLETYGLGNAPEDRAFLDIIHEAASNGIIIVNCSQCPTAKIKMSAYRAGVALQNAGVVSGGDMTIEAVLAKLLYLFSKKLPLIEIKKQIAINLRGELTV